MSVAAVCPAAVVVVWLVVDLSAVVVCPAGILFVLPVFPQVFFPVAGLVPGLAALPAVFRRVFPTGQAAEKPPAFAQKLLVSAAAVPALFLFAMYFRLPSVLVKT